MADFGNTTVFNPVDGNNTSGTQPSWSGSAQVLTIDDAGRALQGAIARDYEFRNATKTTTNSGNAYTLAYTVAPSALVDGMTYSAKFNAANTGSATINIGIGGAKAIKVFNTTANLRDVTAGEIIVGPARLTWLASSDCFILDQAGVFPAAQTRAYAIFDGTSTQSTTLPYTQSGTTVTVTENAHGRLVGHAVKPVVQSGNANFGDPDDTGLFIQTVTANTFTLTAISSASVSGNIRFDRRTIIQSAGVKDVAVSLVGRYWVNLAQEAPTDYVILPSVAKGHTTQTVRSITSSNQTTKTFRLSIVDSVSGFLDSSRATVSVQW